MRLKSAVCAGAVATALLPALAHRARGRAAAPTAGHVRGALHVHTGLSRDGGGGVDEVARAARAAGLQFVALTDHNTDAAAPGPGYRHGVLVIVGMEKSSDAGHALVLGTGPLPFRLDGEPAAVARDVADLGGFVVAAHPASADPEQRWGSDFTGVAGLEVVNLAERGAWPQGRGLGLPLLRALCDPLGALLATHRFSRAPLERWDRTLAERPLAGLLGSDAHGGVLLGPVFVPFPSHRHIFRLASQHLLLERPLTGQARVDERLVLDAVRAGRGWAAFDALADASGFRLQARSGLASGTVGDSVALEEEAEIRAEAGQREATLVLLANGREVARGPRIAHRTRQPGAYRVEAYLEGGGRGGGATPRPWILSNPVYLFPAAELAARAGRASRLPAPEVAPPARELLDGFEADRLGARWQTDRSADARATAAVEQGALRFDYALGTGSRTHASVCDVGPRDLSARSALAFRVRADRRVRFDVQVRVEDPAGGVRIWRRSVRSEPAWTEAVVPLSALRTYDRRGGRPALDRVAGIYFHVDESHLPPGARGTLWIDDVAVGP